MHGQHQAGSLPSRVYERHGVRIYSIGYKRPNGTWAFRLSCHISDQEEIAALREEAIHRAYRGSTRLPTQQNVLYRCQALAQLAKDPATGLSRKTGR